VLHRDIKPSNVAVTPAGRVVLLDFGLAGLEQDARLTTSGSALGSVLYMAPEQVAGRVDEIDVRTDVYALGVTLYELLALEPPFASTDAQQVRASILEDPVPALRARNRAVPRDLELVCLKAMERDRSRRYATMEAFAQDLRNLLHGRAVVARPPSTAYRVRRWIARHPTTSASVALLALLVTVLPTALYVQQRASSQKLRRALDAESAARGLADVRAHEADQVANLLVELFGGADPFAEGRHDVTARQLLDRGMKRVEDELAGQPALQARMYERIGQSYISLDLFDDALVPLDRAVALHRKIDGEDSVVTAESTVLLGSAARCAHRPGTGAMVQRANEILDAAPDVPAHARIQAKYVLALCRFDEGASDASLALLDEARELLPDDASARRDLPWTVLATRAATFAKLGRFAEAETAARETLELDREVHMAINPWRDLALDTLGVALRSSGRSAEACDAYEQLLPGARAFYERESFVLAEMEMHYGAARFDVGRMDGLADVFLRCFDVLSTRHGIVRSKSMAALSYAANALIREGRFDECSAWLDRVDAGATASLERVTPFDALMSFWRGMLALARGERGEAATFLRRAIELAPSGDVDTLATYRAMLARALLGDPASHDEALQLAQQAGESSTAADVRRIARYVRASALLARGDEVGAEPLLREAERTLALGAAPGGADAACSELLAELLISRGELEAGCPLLATTLTALELRLGPHHAELRETLARLARNGITDACSSASRVHAER
jgi:tetratricopeptide (TPR) repeat protein